MARLAASINKNKGNDMNIKHIVFLVKKEFCMIFEIIHIHKKMSDGLTAMNDIQHDSEYSLYKKAK